MWTSWARELSAYAAADGAFQLLLTHNPRPLHALPPHRRQALASLLRAALYALICRYFGQALPRRSLAPSRSLIQAIAIAIAANLCASLARVPIALWPELASLALGGPPSIVRVDDLLHTLALLPLAEELFYRHASRRLSALYTPVVGILLVASLFASRHHDGAGSSLRFFRSCVYSVVAHLTGSPYLASFVCHSANNSFAVLLDEHIATLLPPPPPPLPRCMACREPIGIGAVRFNCTTCPHPSTDMCGGCYAAMGSHKRGHTMERVPVLDFTARIARSRATAGSTATLLAASFALFSARPCIGEFHADTGALALEYRTYAQLHKDVLALAAALRRAPPGSHTVLCGSNSAAWVTSYLAAIYAGHVLCATPPAQLADAMRRVRPATVLCDGPTLPTVCAMAVDSLRMVITLSPAPLVSPPSSVTLLSLTSVLNTAASAQDITPTPRDAEALAAVVWTSGSSGSPKGVLWPDRILHNAAAESLPLYPLVAVDFTPPHHAFALRQTLRVLCNGGQLAIVPGAQSVRLMECVRLARPTFLGAPPAFWIELQRDFSGRLTNPDPRAAQVQRLMALHATRLLVGNRLRVALCGGSASPPSLLAFLRECLAPAHVSDGYAATECGTVTADGRAARGTDVWLDCGSSGDRIGEICVASPSLCAGYLRDPSATAAAFVTRNGRRYYRTGDLGERRADGTVALVGRRAASFKLPQGEFCNPERVESAIETSPFVRAAYVCWHAPAQRLVACVVPSERGLCEQWSVQRYTDEMRRLVQANELQACEAPHTVIVEGQPPAHLTLTDVGRKRPRALLAAHFDPIIARHFSSSSASPPPPTSPTSNPFARLPALAAILTDVLGTSVLTPTQSFAAHGGDSLSAARLARRCQGELGASAFTVAAVLQSPSLYAIESALCDDVTHQSRNVTPSAAVDWPAELQLPNDFYAATDRLAEDIARLAAPPSPVRPMHLLLTGATGFLGPFLLAALLAAHPPPVSVYCIVRADSHKAAEARLRSAVTNLMIKLTEAEWSRVRPLAGQVARPRFGLSLEEYAQLAASVASVYHNAAQVHGILPYSALWPANVGGALEAARLCLMGGGKHLHLISSINVLKPAADRPEAPLSTAEALATLPLVSGYAQTKIVAEALCAGVLGGAGTASTARLLSLSIHRPATISGSTLSGASNVHCFSSGVLCGLARLGCYPEEGSVFPPFFLLTPVDFVGTALATIGRAQAEPCAAAQVWHYVTSRPTAVADLLAELQANGFALRAVDAASWRRAVEAMGDDNMLYVFRDQLLSGSLGSAHHALGPQSLRTRTRLRALAPELQCPPLSTAVWRRYFAFLTERGLLPPVSGALLSAPALIGADDTFFHLQEWYPLVATHTPPSVWLTLTAADLALLASLRRALAAPPRRRRDQPFTTTLTIAAAGLARGTGAASATFGVEEERGREERSQFVDRLKALHNDWLQSSAAQAEALTALLAALGLLMRRVADPVMGCFVRLGSRSPKDSTLSVTSLSAPAAASLPLASDPLLRNYWSMSVATAHDALALLLTSSRVQQDVHSAMLEGTPVTVIARRFVARDPYWEFRLFVANGALTAASVYHTRVYSAAIAAKQREIAAYLTRRVFPTLAPLIPRTAYTLDVFLSPDLGSFTLVELNPPPPVADTALFSLQAPADVHKLTHGPFELRVVTQQQ